MASKELQSFIAARPHLIWYSKDYARMGEESIVQAALNYGNWDDVQELLRIMGVERAAEVFYRDMSVSPRRRGNYHPKTLHYFLDYFKRHAPEVYAQ